jgi:hypothetical protein
MLKISADIVLPQQHCPREHIFNARNLSFATEIPSRGCAPVDGDRSTPNPLQGATEIEAAG